MPKYVRVKHENGDEVTVGAVLAAALGLKPLKKPATSLDGRPLPPKPSRPLGTLADEASNKEKD